MGGVCIAGRVLRLRHAEVFADLPREVLVYLVMTGNSAALVQGGVMPPRVVAAFPQQ